MARRHAMRRDAMWAVASSVLLPSITTLPCALPPCPPPAGAISPTDPRRHPSIPSSARRGLLGMRLKLRQEIGRECRPRGGLRAWQASCRRHWRDRRPAGPSGPGSCKSLVKALQLHVPRCGWGVDGAKIFAPSRNSVPKCYFFPQKRTGGPMCSGGFCWLLLDSLRFVSLLLGREKEGRLLVGAHLMDLARGGWIGPWGCDG